MESQDSPVTIPALQQMKREGRKIVGVVAWDYQIAQIVDRVGVEIVSVGDTVGINLWGRVDPLEVTMSEMLVVCKAVRRGVKRALVSCDFPFGPLQQGADSAVKAAILLAKEGGANMVKLDGAARQPVNINEVSRAEPKKDDAGSDDDDDVSPEDKAPAVDVTLKETKRILLDLIALSRNDTAVAVHK